MRTEYCFDANTGELLMTTGYLGTEILRTNYVDELYKDRTHIFVTEGVDAEREFFNHFGDDSSWPEGWYAKVTTGKFTKLSWTRENYPPSKVSWQEYFGVPSP